MSVLSEEKVLRINCPGFGVSSILPLGEAKPLAMYEVIVINPTSVLHLFENNSELVKQIEVLQSDGMTSYRAENDTALESIAAEFELRAQELNQFLKKGGLLIFFLAPPFTVSGPSLSMDNYSWLQEWCPDKPSGPNHRNMSSTIRGKAIEVVADTARLVEAARSVWVPYLKQAGLEWSTIIRNDNLTEGFVPLAVAGPNKCIAGFKSSGERAGQVVFLPAPYQPEYDAKLKESLERWYALHTDQAAVSSGLKSLSKGLSNLLNDDSDSEKVAPVDGHPVDGHVNGKDGKQADGAPAHNDEPIAHGNGVPIEPPQFFDEPGESVNSPKPEELMNLMKMREDLPAADAPQWCSQFSFEELDGLREQLEEINEGISKAQARAREIEGRINVMNGLKNALLSADGEHLTGAVSQVFERLGFTVKPALGTSDELWLVENEATQAIVRLVYSTTQPSRSELAALAESVITYWGAHEVEPKGILVASTWADKPPEERNEEDFGESISDFARRKNLSLLTTAQLLSIFRDLDLGKLEAKEVRENILSTSGKVSEYRLNMKGTIAARR